jgi:L-ribulokinase
MAIYTIGLDFGTESARAVVVDTTDGREVMVRDYRYRHGVMDHALPNGRPLPPRWALQHPQDYLEAAVDLLSAAADAVGGPNLVGIGLAFTASTVLPTTADGTPLCMLPTFVGEPHAYVKLWKHHSAAPQAARIVALGGDCLAHTGGVTSAEWLHAKALETFENAPAVFAASDRFIEAGDWLVWQMVGKEVRSACHAGFKAHYQKEYPPSDWLEQLAPGFGALNDRLAPPTPVGACAGGVTDAWAQRTGLIAGTPVAVAVIDAHAAVPGLGVTGPGTLAVVMGTSTCHLLLDNNGRPAPGIAGVVEGGVYPGWYAYEAGQAATGDMLSWWVHMLAGPDEVGARHHQLECEARALSPGGSGVLAVDWWNGSRTPLMDSRLAGVLIGLRIETQPSDIYRALLEATAFGNRQVIERLEQQIGPVAAVRVSGGLTQNTLLMQIVADVLGREIAVASTPHASARGAAIYGALAAGLGDVAELCGRMAVCEYKYYRPDRASTATYDQLYAGYRELHQHFGEGGTALLQHLRHG